VKTRLSILYIIPGQKRQRNGLPGLAAVPIRERLRSNGEPYQLQEDPHGLVDMADYRARRSEIRAGITAPRAREASAVA
jgi:hypothetical protein